MKKEIKLLLIFALAKELATSSKFAKHLEKLVKEHNEHVAENGKDGDAPIIQGYISVTNEKIDQLVGTYAESANALTWVLPILEKNPLDDDELRMLTTLLADMPNRWYNDVRSDGGTKLYYDDEYVNAL